MLLTLLFHVTGPMVTCYAVWTVLVHRLPVTVAAIATLLTPAIGVASSVVLLGDVLTWQKIAALVLILASIVLSLAYQKKSAS